MFKTNKEKVVSIDLALRITFTLLALAVIYLVDIKYIKKENISIAVVISIFLYHSVSKSITFWRLRHLRKVSNTKHTIKVCAYDTKEQKDYEYEMIISIALCIFKNRFYVKMKKGNSSESRSFNSYIKFDDSDERKFSVIFNYENEPYLETDDFLSHIGMGEIKFSDGELVSLHYFNDPVKRPTYGSMIIEEEV